MHDPHNRGGWAGRGPLDEYGREAELEWPAPMNEKLNLRAEIRKLSLSEKHQLLVEWMPYSGAEIQQTSKGLSMKLKKLTPNTLYTFRLVPISAAGTPGEPLGQFQFRTPPVHRTSVQTVVLFVLFVALGVVLWLRFVARKI